MGKRNYLIEGVSGTGKTSVCHELRRRGYVAINGDRELAYQGDPTTGEKTEDFGGEAEADGTSHHIWDVEKVSEPGGKPGIHEVTFFCGGSRNFAQFIELFDEVFVLDVDVETCSMNGSTTDQMMTGASTRTSGNSSCVYTLQKKTRPAVASR